MGITVGLIAGIAFSLLTVVMEAYTVRGRGLERGVDDVYRDQGMYTGLSALDNVTIYRFEAPLFFANTDKFKSQLYANLKQQSGTCEGKNEINANVNGVNDENIILQSSVLINDDQSEAPGELAKEVKAQFHSSVVVDCSAITYIDIQGINMLKHIRDDLKQTGVNFALSACPESLLAKLEHGGYTGNGGSEECLVFVTVHDAVAYLA